MPFSYVMLLEVPSLEYDCSNHPAIPTLSNGFGEHTEWSDKSTVKVAVTVDAPSVVKLVLDRLMGS